MRGALGEGMNAVFFGLKRAHQSVLRITRGGLAEVGLTPARFDMMFALRSRHGASQRYLQRLLGVTRATVSKMLSSLEKLGFIVRSVNPHDRRRKTVKLTAAGRMRFVQANMGLRRSGWAQLAVESALGDGRLKYHWYDAQSCQLATSDADGILSAFRRNYGDGATLVYPWGPDDTLPDEDECEAFDKMDELRTEDAPPGGIVDESTVWPGD